MKKSNTNKTTNNATAYKSTLSANVDLFASDWRITRFNQHKNKNEQLINALNKAFREDPQLAFYNLLYLIDVRGGKGENEATKIAIRYLNNHYPKLLIKYLKPIIDLCRWDRLLNQFIDFNPDVQKAIIKLVQTNQSDPLMFKWIPSINCSNSQRRQNALAIAKALKMDHKQYRQFVTIGRHQAALVERSMSTKQWQNIKIDQLPKRALLKYRHVLNQKLPLAYQDYLASLKTKTVALNTINPVEILKTALSNQTEDVVLANRWWDQLKINVPNALVVCDVSGSMDDYVGQNTRAIEVAAALSLLVAKHNPEPLKNKIMIFSDDSEIRTIDENQLEKQYQQLIKNYPVASTNFESVFLTLYNLQIISPQAKIDKIICFSDMQFNEQIGTDQTIWNKWKDKFAKANLAFPQVIFWNINAKSKTFPVTINDLGVLCISGYSQHLLDLFSNDFQGTFDLKTQMVDLLIHKYQNNFKI